MVRKTIRIKSDVRKFEPDNQFVTITLDGVQFGSYRHNTEEAIEAVHAMRFALVQSGFLVTIRDEVQDTVTTWS